MERFIHEPRRLCHLLRTNESKRSIPGERRHQLPAQALSVAIARDDQLELADQLRAGAARQPRRTRAGRDF